MEEDKAKDTRKVVIAKNIEPAQCIEELFTDYELDSSHPPDKLAAKITHDLTLLENELNWTLSRTQTLLKELEREIESGIVPDLTETSADATQTKPSNNNLATLIKTRELLSDLHEQVFKCKEHASHLSPIQSMGGYRSLLVCLIDSATILCKGLEKSGEDGLPGKLVKA
jgi:hypothetical protein